MKKSNFEKMDAKADKKQGVKEDSKKDMALDKMAMSKAKKPVKPVQKGKK